MWMMDLEVRQEHAENTHHLVFIKNPDLLHGPVDTKIGPVLQVKVTCCLDQHGIEIQVPSKSKDGSNSWIIISRGPKPLRGGIVA